MTHLWVGAGTIVVRTHVGNVKKTVHKCMRCLRETTKTPSQTERCHGHGRGGKFRK